jgi:phenylacetate-CoA ligase
MTDRVKNALQSGDAEYVITTGTNHDRMQLIRPPFFLLKQYFKLWSQHPSISHSYHDGCMRLSLTTYRATQHVSKAIDPTAQERTFGERTLYLNKSFDPADWDEKEMKRMVKEIEERHPYHLDVDPFYLALFVKKLKRLNLWKDFPHPRSIIHAYEFCQKAVSDYLCESFSCPIVNLFGSTELGFLFSTMKDQPMIPYLDDIELELIPVAHNSSIYNLIVTTMRNPFMPLIRYKSGDLVETIDDSADPKKIWRASGREKEIIYLSSKKPLAHATFDDLIHEMSSDIFHYQLELTDSRPRFTYTTFSDQALMQDTASDLTRSLEELLETPCATSHENRIAPVKSGKYAWQIKNGVSFDG